jgi:hypothetical protein
MDHGIPNGTNSQKSVLDPLVAHRCLSPWPFEWHIRMSYESIRGIFKSAAFFNTVVESVGLQIAGSDDHTLLIQPPHTRCRVACKDANLNPSRRWIGAI